MVYLLCCTCMSTCHLARCAHSVCGSKNASVWYLDIVRKSPAVTWRWIIPQVLMIDVKIKITIRLWCDTQAFYRNKRLFDSLCIVSFSCLFLKANSHYFSLSCLSRSKVTGHRTAAWLTAGLPPCTTSSASPSSSSFPSSVRRRVQEANEPTRKVGERETFASVPFEAMAHADTRGIMKAKVFFTKHQASHSIRQRKNTHVSCTI